MNFGNTLIESLRGETTLSSSMTINRFPCLQGHGVDPVDMGYNRAMERAESEGRTTIGFLSSSIDDPYQNAVWAGATEEAERLGISLVFYGGYRLDSPFGNEAIDNYIFDIAGKSNHAGLIVISNSICMYSSMEEFERFIGRFSSKPIVSAGLEVPGVPWVGIANEGGMRDVAEHLVRVHGRRDFLFLAGTKAHRESQARLAEFLESAEALGVPPPRVEHCEFQQSIADARVGALLASGARMDAVVAANDKMAIGAIRALGSFGLEVPRDVSVTGFDDTAESRVSTPPLTTVHQPMDELGRSAVRHLAAQLGIARAQARTPGVTFIVRESCGCPNEMAGGFSPKPMAAEGKGAARDALIALSMRVNAELRKGRNPAGLRSSVRGSAIAERALLLISEGETRYQAQRLEKADRNAAILRTIEASLVSSFALAEILEGVARGTRALGISACWLALFEYEGSPYPPQDASPPAWSRLILASTLGCAEIHGLRGPRFRTSELLPGGFPQEWSAYVCEGLRFGKERLGYLICTADAEDKQVYAALRDQASSALKGAALMAAERDRERRLELEVKRRTTELSASNVQLREEMKERKALERELIGVANRIMERIGMDIHDNLCQDIAGMGVMAARLEYALRRDGNPEAETAGALVRTAGETASKAKGMARGLYPAEIEADGILGAVERLAQGARARSGADIVVEADEGFALPDGEKAIHLYRIVQEALSNAVRHSGAKRISIRLAREDGSVLVEVRDDGKGLPDPAEESSGLGLKILRYRASLMGGELSMERESPGTRIALRLRG
jgi:DNA-binding LacI/PurR family transcriptional regulator/signal transduction histidine kinase